MVELPSRTLLSSLQKVVDHPKEYLADACCRFNDIELWIHQGILLSRCPPAFLHHFAPCLNSNNNSNNETSTTRDNWIIDVDDQLSSSLFKVLINYWYTANLEPLLSLPAHLDKELDTLENKLGAQLLPRIHTMTNTGDNDMATMQQDCYTQLLEDLDRMRQEELGCDINLNLFTATDTYILLPAHRFILASQSTYFYAMFCTDFCESQNSDIQLTDHFFTPMVMQVILHYLYTGTVYVSPPPQLADLPTKSSSSSLTKIQKLTMKKHWLRTLQMTFGAADYLGQMKTLGRDVLHAMSRTCDDFKCLCHDCVKLLPFMLSFADKKKKDDPTMAALRTTLITLYSDPANAIEHLWSQKPFAILVQSAAATSMMMDTPTVISEISEQISTNLTKHNAIHVLHALHLCFSKLRSADLTPTWSLPTLDLLDPILRSTVTMVSQNFDFYCVEYPILVSCVDGIGVGFSFDFLDFLLKRVLDQGIQDTNAGIIYQGIVKDLLGRQETVRNVALDDVLLNARMQCTAYLDRRWLSVKSSGGFQYLEKATMRQLAIDIGVPYRTLTKPFDSDLLSLFSFKHKHSKHALKVKTETDPPSIGYATTSRRRSFGTQRPAEVPTTRPRSHSAGATTSFDASSSHPLPTDPSASYVNHNTLNAMSTQPLIHLLSMETEARRYKQEMENDHPTNLQQQQQQQPSCLSTDDYLLDALLPMDDIVPVINRTRQLKFQVPSNGPTHAKSPLHPDLYHQLVSPADPSSTDLLSTVPPLKKKKNKYMKKHKMSTKRSKWGLKGSNGIIINSSSDISEEEDDLGTAAHTTLITPMIGAKVELRRRPLPTFGTIQYVGPVSFANGTWIGLELESRLGKNNGCVSGVTYFHTDSQRGLFVKQDDFTIISIPAH